MILSFSLEFFIDIDHDAIGDDNAEGDEDNDTSPDDNVNYNDDEDNKEKDNDDDDDNVDDVTDVHNFDATPLPGYFPCSVAFATTFPIPVRRLGKPLALLCCTTLL